LSDLGRLLGPGCERRKKDADSENDREPDPPHRHLGWGWLAGVYQDECCCPQELAAWVKHSVAIRPEIGLARR
jgi:hypothetical protein